eukprot:GFYU01010427.1.p1 GENE.GFYU01010427.1~~GFYU01010427.1.p1  ORF type:complete len:1729 (-),score=404.88 GFYU01010427.1:215-5401(-)
MRISLVIATFVCVFVAGSVAQPCHQGDFQTSFSKCHEGNRETVYFTADSNICLPTDQFVKTSCSCNVNDYRPSYGPCDPLTGLRDKDYVKVGDCQNGVAPPAKEIVPCECSMDNVGHTFTSCNGNDNNLSSGSNRTLIYYFKQPKTCEGGVSLPEPRFGLPCNIECKPGEYLDVQCQKCPKDTYSLGPLERFQAPFTEMPKEFLTNCRSDRATNGRCSQWRLTDGLIWSGPNSVNHAINTFLQYPVHLIREGYVKFLFKVDAEPGYDGVLFIIDGNRKMTASHEINWKEFSAPLSPGQHMLEWVYVKDGSMSVGQDSAFIKMIEVDGTKVTSLSCKECPPGSSSEEGSTECSKCGYNMAFDSASDDCVECPPDKFSRKTMSTCEPREQCEESDYVMRYTECKGNQREKYFEWIEPMICNNSTGVALPLERTVVECSPCNPGYYRDPATSNCVQCPTGSYSLLGSKSVEDCHKCEKGHAAIPSQMLITWTEWPAGSSTNCYGDCEGTEGWRLINTYIDSGPNFGPGSHGYFQYPVTIATEDGGRVTFTYNMTSALGPEEDGVSFDFYIDNMPTPLHGAPRKPNQGTKTESYELTQGEHILMWVFAKDASAVSTDENRATISTIIVENEVNGGAPQCEVCPTGTFSSKDEAAHCEVCAIGHAAVGEGSTQCDECPANHYAKDIGSSACTTCGAGTSSAPGADRCEIAGCQFSPDGDETVYDLSDFGGHHVFGDYVVDLCSRDTSKTKCQNSAGEMNTYACKLPPPSEASEIGGVSRSVDLGDELALAPLANQERTALGVTVTTVDGEKSIEGIADGDCPRGHVHSAIFHLECDQFAGNGAPTLVKMSVGTDTCVHEFLWRSINACPMCTERDWSSLVSDCTDDRRRKNYFWNEPRLCHGGKSLPEPEELPCLSPIVCGPGFRLTEAEECEECTAGEYSAGGGRAIMEWHTLNTLTTSCDAGDASDCSGWIPKEHSVTSGLTLPGDRSILALTVNAVRAGEVSYHFKVNKASATSVLQFKIDGKAVSVADYTAGYTKTSAPLPIGTHSLEWVFVAGMDSTGDDHAVIRDIVVVGTSFHELQCEACPPGTFSSQGSGECTPCPSNQFSLAHAQTCQDCSPKHYSLGGAAQCIERKPCTDDDWYVADVCDASQGKRVYQWSEPRICCPKDVCPEGVALPTDEDIDCGTLKCGDGQRRSPTTFKCEYCPAGHFGDGNECKPAVPGMIAVRERAHRSFEAGWPEGFSTGCFGQCTGQWRQHGSHISTGPATAAISNSFVRYEVMMASNGGTLEFAYTLEGCPHQTLLALHIVDGSTEKVQSHLALDMAPADSPVVKTVDLAAGAQTILWDFENECETGIATISKIVVKGTTEGAPAAAVACPAGTYTDKVGQSQCVKCPRGHVAPNAGAVACDPCGSDTAAPEEGMTQCLACGLGTRSELPSGSTKCLSTCTFTHGNVTYDISNLAHKHEKMLGPFNDREGRTFEFGLCFSNHTSNFCGDNSYSCLTEGGNTHNIARMREFIVDEANPTDGFVLRLYHGDKCDHNGNLREMEVHFMCNKDAGSGVPQSYLTGTGAGWEIEKEDTCTYHFQWETVHACPVCLDRKTDYTKVVGSCVAGERVTTYHPKDHCFAPIERDVSQCSSVEFSDGIIITIVVSFVVLVIVIGVMYYRQRKLYSAYAQLMEPLTREEDGDIMDDVDADQFAVPSASLPTDREEYAGGSQAPQDEDEFKPSNMA